jgi:hypothetical protein
MVLILTETIVNRDENLLSSWQLIGTSSESLEDIFHLILLNSDRDQLISDSDSGSLTIRLTIGLSHTRLKSICSGTGQHFVDSEYVPWVGSHSEVEFFFGHFSDEILIDGDSASFKSLRSDLFLLIRNQVDTIWERTPVSLLGTSVEESEFGVWAGSVVSALRISLSFDISITSEWSSTHAL